tara:strand:- start:307 stop:492 length:186 start_codon:yes stop_codon:yes gene_type:complete
MDASVTRPPPLVIPVYDEPLEGPETPSLPEQRTNACSPPTQEETERLDSVRTRSTRYDLDE